jgi:hypothetical protein
MASRALTTAGDPMRKTSEVMVQSTLWLKRANKCHSGSLINHVHRENIDKKIVVVVVGFRS